MYLIVFFDTWHGSQWKNTRPEKPLGSSFPSQAPQRGCPHGQKPMLPGFRCFGWRQTVVFKLRNSLKIRFFRLM